MCKCARPFFIWPPNKNFVIIVTKLSWKWEIILFIKFERVEKTAQMCKRQPFYWMKNSDLDYIHVWTNGILWVVGKVISCHCRSWCWMCQNLTFSRFSFDLFSTWQIQIGYNHWQNLSTFYGIKNMSDESSIIYVYVYVW